MKANFMSPMSAANANSYKGTVEAMYTAVSILTAVLMTLCPMQSNAVVKIMKGKVNN